MVARYGASPSIFEGAPDGWILGRVCSLEVESIHPYWGYRYMVKIIAVEGEYDGLIFSGVTITPLTPESRGYRWLQELDWGHPEDMELTRESLRAITGLPVYFTVKPVQRDWQICLEVDEIVNMEQRGGLKRVSGKRDKIREERRSLENREEGPS